MSSRKLEAEGQWTVHPLLAGVLLAGVFGGAAGSATVDWRWALAGGGLGFAVGWWFASVARRIERPGR